MKGHKKIFDLLVEELRGMYGDDVAAYNDLYDALIYYVTSSINQTAMVTIHFDVAVFFLERLKECINEVLFHYEE